MPFYPFLREGSSTKNGLQKKGYLILSSLLEDLERLGEEMGLWELERKDTHGKLHAVFWGR